MRGIHVDQRIRQNQALPACRGDVIEMAGLGANAFPAIPF
jgi:hypothetical protein